MEPATREKPITITLKSASRKDAMMELFIFFEDNPDFKPDAIHLVKFWVPGVGKRWRVRFKAKE